MNVYDLIYVQLQLSPFRNEPVSQYSERELSRHSLSPQTMLNPKKDNLENRFLKPEYPFNNKQDTILALMHVGIFM